MKQHEREYFTSRIRSGIIKVDFEDLNLVIKPLTLEQDFYLQEHTLTTYAEAKKDGFLTSEDLLDSLRERGLWSEEEDKKLETIEEDIDKLKVQLFKNRHKQKVVDITRRYLDAARNAQGELLEKKSQYFETSCEGMSQISKVRKLMQLTCHKRLKDGSLELYDFKEVPVEMVVKMYSMQMLTEQSLRELARTEPWRSSWMLNETQAFKLFSNNEKMTQEQASLLVWSKMYDSVHESMDCPPEEVIEDDDMLDGWFIVQRKKREQEKLEAEIEQVTGNSKIANSEEIFVMADTQERADKINQANSVHIQHVKKQRQATINKQGEANDLDFQDQQLKVRQQQNQMYKNKFRS